MKSLGHDNAKLQALIDYCHEGEVNLAEMIESFKSDQRFFLGAQSNSVNPAELYQSKLNLMYCDIVLKSLDDAAQHIYNLKCSLQDLQDKIQRISTPPIQ